MTDDAAIPSLGDYRMIDIGELSGILGLSKPTLWRHEAAGLLPPSVRIGRSVRWRLRDIVGWLDSGCLPRTDAAPSDEAEGTTDGL